MTAAWLLLKALLGTAWSNPWVRKAVGGLGYAACLGGFALALRGCDQERTERLKLKMAYEHQQERLAEESHKNDVLTRRLHTRETILPGGTRIIESDLEERRETSETRWTESERKPAFADASRLSLPWRYTVGAGWWIRRSAPQIEADVRLGGLPVWIGVAVSSQGLTFSDADVAARAGIRW